MQTFKMWTKKLKHKQTNKQTPMYKLSKQIKQKQLDKRANERTQFILKNGKYQI